jgi:hypothetical protein
LPGSYRQLLIVAILPLQPHGHPLLYAPNGIERGNGRFDIGRLGMFASFFQAQAAAGFKHGKVRLIVRQRFTALCAIHLD